MSYTITAALALGMSAQEAAGAATSPSSSTQGASRIFDALNKLLQYNSASYPPVSGRIPDLYTVLSASPTDLDLTAIPTAADIAKTTDLTGFKLVGGSLWAPKANAASIVVSCPANGYPLFGSSSDRITLLAGKRYTWGLDGELDSAFTNPNVAVDATHKLIRLSGTAGTDKLYGILLFGT